MQWKPWDEQWTGPAERDLRRLSSADARRVAEAVARFARTGQGDVAPLTDRPGEWRLRVGGVRVIFTLNRETHTIVILRVRPRGRAY